MSTHAERVRAGERFAVADAQSLLRDLMRPNPRVYWTDLAASTLLGWAAAAVVVVVAVGAGPLHPVVPVAYLVALLAFYRAALFLHEIIHFGSRRSLRGLRRTWNALVGIPMLVPEFLYQVHPEHHSRTRYGTSRDAEYLALARLAPAEIVRILAATPLLGLYGPFRFGLLGPVSWLVPPLRRYVYARASSLKLDLEFRGRPPAPGAETRSWVRQEIACLALLVAVAAGCLTGVVPWAVPLTWYAVTTGVVFLNTLRLLVAHRYLGAEDGMTVVEQMMDTINHPRNPLLAELWGPFGLRLHALHHLLPSLPYHSFPAAHRRLVAALPPDSAYRLTESPGMAHSLRALWSDARSSQRDGAGAPVAAQREVAS